MSGRVFKVYTAVGLVVGSFCGGRQHRWMRERPGTEPGIRTIATVTTATVGGMLWPFTIGAMMFDGLFDDEQK